MRTSRLRLTGTLSILVLTAMALAFTSHPADAAEPSVGLGTAGSFAVLAGTTVTNTGPSVISGDLGVSPQTAVTGFPPGIVTGGTTHSADGVAGTAQADLTTAYNSAAGRANNVTLSAPLVNETLVGGVYTASTSLALNGTITLDAQNVPGTVWIFRAGSTLTTASASKVLLTNGANPCNVFWQVGSSATLGTGTTFVGTVMALTSVTATTGSSVEGRLLARNGAVTLDNNVISLPDCTPAVTTTVENTTTTAEVTTTTAGGNAVTTTSAPETTTTAEVTTTTAGGNAVTTTTAPETTTTAGGNAVTTTIAPETSTTVEGVGSTPTTAGIAAVTTTVAPALDAVTTTTAAGTPALPKAVTPRTPRTPLTPGAPGAPATPAAPGTPGTSTHQELPKTGRNMAPIAGLGGVALVLGAVLVRWSRRNDDTEPTPAW